MEVDNRLEEAKRTFKDILNRLDRSGKGTFLTWIQGQREHHGLEEPLEFNDSEEENAKQEQVLENTSEAIRMLDKIAGDLINFLPSDAIARSETICSLKPLNKVSLNL